MSVASEACTKCIEINTCREKGAPPLPCLVQSQPDKVRDDGSHCCALCIARGYIGRCRAWGGNTEPVRSKYSDEKGLGKRKSTIEGEVEEGMEIDDAGETTDEDSLFGASRREEHDIPLAKRALSKRRRSSPTKVSHVEKNKRSTIEVAEGRRRATNIAEPSELLKEAVTAVMNQVSLLKQEKEAVELEKEKSRKELERERESSKSEKTKLARQKEQCEKEITMLKEKIEREQLQSKEQQEQYQKEKEEHRRKMESQVKALQEEREQHREQMRLQQQQQQQQQLANDTSLKSPRSTDNYGTSLASDMAIVPREPGTGRKPRLRGIGSVRRELEVALKEVEWAGRMFTSAKALVAKLQGEYEEIMVEEMQDLEEAREVLREGSQPISGSLD